MFKRIRFLTLAAALTAVSLSTTANADRMGKMMMPNRSFGIAIDAIRWTFGAYIAQLEFAASDSISITVPLAFVDPGLTFFQAGTIPDFGWAAGTGVGGKFYVTGKTLCHGFYIHGQLAFGLGQAGTAFAAAGNYSAKLGYTWVAPFGLSLDTFAGVNYTAALTANIAALSGVGVTAGALIGWAW